MKLVKLAPAVEATVKLRCLAPRIPESYSSAYVDACLNSGDLSESSSRSRNLSHQHLLHVGAREAILQICADAVSVNLRSDTLE